MHQRETIVRVVLPHPKIVGSRIVSFHTEEVAGPIAANFEKTCYAKFGLQFVEVKPSVVVEKRKMSDYEKLRIGMNNRIFETKLVACIAANSLHELLKNIRQNHAETRLDKCEVRCVHQRLSKEAIVEMATDQTAF